MAAPSVSPEFTEFRGFLLYGSVAEIVQRAGEVAGNEAGGAPVSASMLFFATCDAGDPSRDPEWTADFFRQRLPDDGYRAVRGAYLDAASRQKAAPAEKRKASKMAESQDEPPPLDSSAESALEEAVWIARTTGETEVHARHLAAALLRSETGDRGGPPARIDEMGGDVPSLRAALLAFITWSGEEDAEAWKDVLQGGPSALPSYHADRGRGHDLIGIESEVAAFARLIAAREVAPPLSIGLFGDWGSGKTFFMTQLRRAVNELSRSARESREMQRDQPFYKRIVQIEFNAWHYVEGNLWASLVQHIFENLRVDPEQDGGTTARLRRELLGRLTDAEEKLRRADDALETAERRVERASEDVAKAEKAKKDAEKDLSQLRIDNIHRLFPLVDVQRRLQPLLEKLGLDRAGETAAELERALQDARGALEGSTSLIGRLVRGPGAGQRLVYVAGVGALALLAGAGAVLLEDQIAALASAAVGVTTAVGGFVAWLRKHAAWLRARTGELANVESSYRTRVSEELKRQADQLAAKEAEFEAQVAARDQALERKARAEHAVENARRARDRATSLGLLDDFIRDRTSSEDYRKHLGLAALIRNDFERLSDLITEENWRLGPLLPGETDETERNGLRRFADLDEEEKDAAKRINRIVLYIDDLDRCPPRRVVEVLQAVHLLLAFELFVVVVGVDARWIKRSLRARYKELLHADDIDLQENAELIGKATTSDYLEKIFQIPFWLRPMEPRQSARMVRGLLGGSLSSPNDARAQGPTGGDAQGRDVEGSTPGSTGGDGEESDDRASRPEGQSAAESREDAEGAPSTPEAPEVELARVTIQSEELEDMLRLAPLLGRSPRALKRFVNVYRLIRAGLGRVELARFLDPERKTHRAAQFLLAVEAGAPRAGPLVFREVSAHADRDRLIEALEAVDPDEEDHEDRMRVASWLRSAEAAIRLFENPDDLATWVPRVARYSFTAAERGPIREQRGMLEQRGGSEEIVQNVSPMP